MNKFPSNEYELIRRVQSKLPPSSPLSPYELTIGDDAAIRVNNAAGERLIITADVSVENVHFSTNTMTFEEIGYKSMVSNLSDCAAMGAKPDGAVVQLVFPKIGIDNKSIDTNININTNNNAYPDNAGININNAIEQIYAGFSKACERWNFPIIGGDLSGGAVWTIGITLIGSAPPGGRLLRRTSISDGDALWVTGVPGESAAGFSALAEWGRGRVPPQYKRFVNAHVTPEPAVDTGAALAANPSVHAMMDLSDGLSKDIATLCFDNNLGFVFDADALKNAPSEMMDLADDLRVDFRDWFYHGGEEYELLFACEASFDPRGIDKSNIMRLGHFTSKVSGVMVLGDGGVLEELRMKGWDHI
jgi:thiamine-monophosphate kinase